MILPIAAPLPPLYRARVVRMDLLPYTEVYDARRDLRAVGWTFAGGSDVLMGPRFFVHGGRVTLGEGYGGPALVALIGKRGFAVRQIGNGPESFREGQIVDGRIVPGRRLARAPRPARGVSPSREETVGLPPLTTYGLGWSALGMGTREGIGWIPLRPPRPGISAKVGAVEGWIPGPSEDVRDGTPTAVALIRANGKVTTLADRTVGYAGTAFGRVLWVSPEGWLVVTHASNGLAWLEQVGSPGS